MAIDRSEVTRALAKAIAYHDCQKPQEARYWAAQVVAQLYCSEILDPEYVRTDYAAALRARRLAPAR